MTAEAIKLMAVACRIANGGAVRLTVDQEEELLTSLQDIRSGKYEDGHELLRELKELARRNPGRDSRHDED
jgi:hypothetical protein